MASFSMEQPSPEKERDGSEQEDENTNQEELTNGSDTPGQKISNLRDNLPEDTVRSIENQDDQADSRSEDSREDDKTS